MAITTLFPDKYKAKNLDEVVSGAKSKKNSSSSFSRKLLFATAALATALLPSQAYAQSNREYTIPPMDITVNCDEQKPAIYNNQRAGSRIAIEEGCSLTVTNPTEVARDSSGRDKLPTQIMIQNAGTRQYLENNQPSQGKSARIFPLSVNSTNAGMKAGENYSLYVAVPNKSSASINVDVVARQNATPTTIPQENMRQETPNNAPAPAPVQSNVSQSKAQPNTTPKQANLGFISGAYAFGNRQNGNNPQDQTTFTGASIRGMYGAGSTFLDASVNYSVDRVGDRVLGNTILSNRTTQANISIAQKLIPLDNIAVIATGEVAAARHKYAVQGARTFSFGNGLPISNSTAVSGGAGIMLGDYRKAFVQGDVRFLMLMQESGLQNNFFSDFITSSRTQTGYVASASIMAPFGSDGRNFISANVNKSHASGLGGSLSTDTTNVNGIAFISIPTKSKSTNIGVIIGASVGDYRQVDLSAQARESRLKQYAIKVGIGLKTR